MLVNSAFFRITASITHSSLEIKWFHGDQVPLSSEETIYANELSDDKNKNDEDNEADDRDMSDEEWQ